MDSHRGGGLCLVDDCISVPESGRSRQSTHSGQGMVAFGAILALDFTGFLMALSGLNLVRMDQGASQVLVITHAVAEGLGVIGVAGALASFASDSIKFTEAAARGTV